MFKEQYIRDNEKLHVKEALFMEIQNKLNEEQKRDARRGSFVRWAAVAAAALLVIGGALGALLHQSRIAPAEAGGQMSASAQSANDYDTLYDMIEVMNGARGIMMNDMGGVDMAVATDETAAEEPMAAEPMEGAASGSVTSAACDADFSETNVQVQGVDEADIVKTDGKYIYYIADNTLYIAQAGGRDTRVLSRTPLGGEDDKYWRQAQEMFLLGDRLMVVSQGWATVWVAREGDGYESGRDSTQMTVYDLSDRRSPQKAFSLGQSGSYVSSRMIGEHVYLVTTQYVYDAVRGQPETYVPVMTANETDTLLPASDILYCGEPMQSAYTVIGSVNLKSGTAHESAKAVFGSTGTVYANTEHLLVAQSDYKQDVSDIAPDETGKNVQVTRSEASTKLVLFALDGGSIEKLASGAVAGSLINQFAMDEYKGVFRIVTTVSNWTERIYTDGVDQYEYEDENYNCLYTFDQSLKMLGKIERLAEDEWVESVRFDGDIGYFVTFRQTDPLFAVDLSDPSKPRVLSALKIPGFSEYLHVYGDGLLLGIGYQADEETGMRQGVKLSMFDTSDKADVKEVTTALLNADYTVVGANHKAILADAEKNIIAFPADNAYYIYAYDAQKGFELLKKVDVGEYIYDGSLRGLFIGRSFYVLSGQGITVISMTGWEKLIQLDW